MKNLVRAFVIVLTLTGSVAYTQIASASSVKVSVKSSWMPTPCCPPGGQDTCGIR